MNRNVAMQNEGRIAWDGATGDPIDVTGHNYFAWSLHITADIAADAVFDVMYHDADPADPCTAGPAMPVNEIPLCYCCNQGADVAAQFVIPAGTLAGSTCAGTIPCRPGKFVSLVGSAGDVANVQGVLILHGVK